MRLVLSIRCLPRISSSSTSPVHRLPHWGDLWREQTSKFELWSSSPPTGRTFVWSPANSSNPLQRNTSPHRHSQLSNLVPEAGFFCNICDWLSQTFGSNAASRIFFGWLTAYTKFGLNPAWIRFIRAVWRSVPVLFASPHRKHWNWRYWIAYCVHWS